MIFVVGLRRSQPLQRQPTRCSEELLEETDLPTDGGREPEHSHQPLRFRPSRGFTRFLVRHVYLTGTLQTVTSACMISLVSGFGRSLGRRGYGNPMASSLGCFERSV